MYKLFRIVYHADEWPDDIEIDGLFTMDDAEAQVTLASECFGEGYAVLVAYDTGEVCAAIPSQCADGQYHAVPPILSEYIIYT